MRCLIVCLLCCFMTSKLSHGYLCPCSDNKRNATLNINNLKICVMQASGGSMTFDQFGAGELENFKILQHTNSSAQLHSCTVLIHVRKDPVDQSKAYHRSLCPGKCRPFPEVTVNENLLTDLDAVGKNTAVTCSLTVEMLRKGELTKLGSSRALYKLKEIAARRMMECYERSELHKQSTLTGVARNTVKERVSRRKVKAVVMWMGTQDNLALIAAQSLALQHVPDQRDEPSNIVIAWAATDEVHPCLEESTKCLGGTKQFNGLLPPSAMNFMPSGWRCAQRRPLRSLAHVLALYAPSYVILLDDDTYLNYELLMQRYGDLLMDELYRRPIYMGEFLGRTGDRGHLSTQGIFAGGSGYIIGHNLLSRLQQRAVTHFGFEGGAKGSGGTMSTADPHRSVLHRMQLSVLHEGLQNALHACSITDPTVVSTSPNPKNTASCILSTSPRPMPYRLRDYNATSQQMVVPIAVRLIDFCVNLMANEHTCQHSDHSLGRCMLYGAEAIPLGVACHSAVPLTTLPNGVRVGMCFMSPQCNTSEQITCHRYRASDQMDPHTRVPIPERNSHKDGYYRHHSSVFDGTKTECF